MHTSRHFLLSALLIAAAALPAPSSAQQVTPAPAEPARRPAAVPVENRTTAPAGEETVVLSPFTVAGEADRGYQALNTLSGTRLNSKLEDLGASITVVTKQQMQDLALLDINDVFRYEASTEGTDNFTTFIRNRSGGVNDQVQSDPQRANRVRGLSRAGSGGGGGANTAWGSFSSNPNIPFDPYNIAAIEISRGPNSNLFGLGQAAGTVSVVPSQANLHRRTYQGDLRFDSYGGHRQSLNLNTPIFEGKLALRVAAVNEERAYVRKPSGDEIRRGFVTLHARPFRNTTIRASAESYRNDFRRPNSITPRDTTTEWRAAGSPTWDPVSMMVTLANGTRQGPFAADSTSVALPGLGINTTRWLLPEGLIGGYNSFYARSYVYMDRDGIRDFSVARTNNPVTGTALPSNPFNGGNSSLRHLTSGTAIMRQRDVLGPAGLPLYLVPGTSDRSVYDWTEYNVVAPNHGTDRAKTYSAELEQVVVQTPRHLVAAKLGAFQQKYSRRTYELIDNLETVIYVDVNEKRLDGTPNPYFRRPYIQSTTPNLRYFPENDTILAADLAYELTPNLSSRWLKWILKQRFAGHKEKSWEDYWETRFAARVTSTNHAWIAPGALNLVGSQPLGHRWYLGDAQGQNVDYGTPPIGRIAGRYPLTWYNNRTGAWVNEPVTVEEVLNSGTAARRRTEIRTSNATYQGYFFDNRLVLTAGLRRDAYRQRTGATSVVDPATGLAVTTDKDVFGPALGFIAPSGARLNLPGWGEYSGDTKTYGAVVKLTKWLSAHVNTSDSFTPEVVRQKLDSSENLPNPQGKSTEWGISLSSPDGKFHVRINRFQSKELLSRGSEVGTLGNRYLDMEGRPDGGNNIQISSFRYFCQQIALGRFAAAGNPRPAQAELDQAVAKLMGVSQEWYNRLVYSGASQPQTAGTTDVSARGYDFEATYNPTRNWRMKFTGSKTRAQDDQVSPDIYNWWQQRLPVWTTVRADIVPGDGRGRLWWDTAPGDFFAGGETRTPQTRWTQDQYAAYWAAATNVGRPRSQMREYRFTGITSYDFSEGLLKNVTLGGAVRWESKASIGYMAGAPETSGPYQGAVLFLDNDKPVWDKARYYVDVSAAYRFKLFSDKVRMRAQVNVKNAFEDGRLQAIAVNPDGSPYAYRIIDPRQFIFTLSFEL